MPIMKTEPQPSDREVLAGLVERVIYQNADNGFCVIKARGHRDLVTVETSAPTSVEGIEKYLASGMIRGIGPVYAKKLLRAFGEKVFDVIEAEPNRLGPASQVASVTHCWPGCLTKRCGELRPCPTRGATSPA
jgi:exodeoxyribonuclease V alpha subunit